MTQINKIIHHYVSHNPSFPPSKIYRELYQRYICEDKLKRFLDLIPSHKYEDSYVLDLCCGNGRAGLETKKRGSKEVIFVDKSYDMFELHGRYEFVNLDVHTYLSTAEREFDIAICQESINYWFDEKSAALLSRAIKQDGYFIFNTYGTFDKNQILVLNYEIDGRHYVEFVHRNDSDIMTHVQICNNITHIHSFKHIRQEHFINQLSKYFHVDCQKENNTLLFTCIRK